MDVRLFRMDCRGYRLSSCGFCIRREHFRSLTHSLTHRFAPSPFLDNAIYPVLFLDYLFQVFGNQSDDINPVLRFCLLSGTTILLAYINWKGLPVVGKMSVGICVVALSPFLVLVIVGAFKCDPSRWLMLPTRDVHKIIQGEFCKLLIIMLMTLSHGALLS